jgi:Fur family transcriptional regulator, peroxide stress response regulator
LIQELNFPKGQARFDSYMKPHVNLICLKCGNITDLDDSITKEIANRVANATKFMPNGQRIDIYGICQKCSTQPTSSSKKSNEISTFKQR